MKKIHHTRGVYANGEYKDNAVRAEDLESHIEYNKTFRFGRALLVDGVVRIIPPRLAPPVAIRSPVWHWSGSMKPHIGSRSSSMPKFI